MFKIKSQWIDSYGKTRRLNLQFVNQKITLIVSPIQPLKVREKTNSPIFLTDIDTAMKLADTLGMQVSSQTVTNGPNGPNGVT